MRTRPKGHGAVREGDFGQKLLPGQLPTVGINRGGGDRSQREATLTMSVPMRGLIRSNKPLADTNTFGAPEVRSERRTVSRIDFTRKTTQPTRRPGRSHESRGSLSVERPILYANRANLCHTVRGGRKRRVVGPSIMWSTTIARRNERPMSSVVEKRAESIASFDGET